MNELVSEIFPDNEREKFIANLVLAAIPIFIISNQGFDSGRRPIAFFAFSILGAVLSGSIFSINDLAYFSLFLLRVVLAAMLWSFGTHGQAWAAIFLLLPFSLYLQAIHYAVRTFTESINVSSELAPLLALSAVSAGWFLTVAMPRQPLSWALFAVGFAASLQPRLTRAIGLSQFFTLAVTGVVGGTVSLLLLRAHVPVGWMLALFPTLWAVQATRSRKDAQVAVPVRS